VQGLAMSRAIVLILCLVAAGAIAASSYDGTGTVDRSDTVKVFTVPARPETPAAPSPPSPSVTVDLPADKAALTRQLQRELKRVGCYAGDINGVWTTSSRVAMKAFVDQVNASLPIHSPDPVLLSLVRGHPDGTCVATCPPAGVCEPPGVPTKPGGEQAASFVAPAATAAAATAASAAMATTAAPKPGAKPDPALSPPASDAARPDQPRSDTSNRKAARDRKTNRSWKDPAKPPRFVRDFLRSVERTFKLP
jgi:hypothetical protein